MIVDHVALTVSDWERSHGFYTAVLGLLNGSEVANGTGSPHRHSAGRWRAFSGSTMITLWEALPEHRTQRFVMYAPGLHHLAFTANSREAITQMHDLAVSLGAEILGAPAIDEAKGCALFFLDPDGMKLEYRFKV